MSSDSVLRNGSWVWENDASSVEYCKRWEVQFREQVNTAVERVKTILDHKHDLPPHTHESGVLSYDDKFHLAGMCTPMP